MSRRRFRYDKKLGKVVEVVLFEPRPNRSAAVHIMPEHFNRSLGQVVTSKNDCDRKFREAGLAPIEDFPHCVEGVHKTERTKPDIKDAMDRARARLKERGEI